MVDKKRLLFQIIRVFVLTHKIIFLNFFLHTISHVGKVQIYFLPHIRSSASPAAEVAAENKFLFEPHCCVCDFICRRDGTGSVQGSEVGIKKTTTVDAVLSPHDNAHLLLDATRDDGALRRKQGTPLVGNAVCFLPLASLQGLPNHPFLSGEKGLDKALRSFQMHCDKRILELSHSGLRPSFCLLACLLLLDNVLAVSASADSVPWYT